MTLNARDRIDPAKVIAVMDYEHPIYDLPSRSRPSRLLTLVVDRPCTAFAGAYHGWGFHEDGCRSGVEAARRLGVFMVTNSQTMTNIPKTTNLATKPTLLPALPAIVDGIVALIVGEVRFATSSVTVPTNGWSTSTDSRTHRGTCARSPVSTARDHLGGNGPDVSRDIKR